MGIVGERGIGDVRVEKVHPKEETIALIPFDPIDGAVGNVVACRILAEPIG